MLPLRRKLKPAVKQDTMLGRPPAPSRDVKLASLQSDVDIETLPLNVFGGKSKFDDANLKFSRKQNRGPARMADEEEILRRKRKEASRRRRGGRSSTILSGA